LSYDWSKLIQRWQEWPNSNLAEFAWHYHIPYESLVADRLGGRFHPKHKRAAMRDITPASARSRLLNAVPTFPRINEKRVRSIVGSLVQTAGLFEAYVTDRLSRVGPPGPDGVPTRIPAGNLNPRDANLLASMLARLSGAMTELAHLSRVVGLTEDSEVEPVPVLATMEPPPPPNELPPVAVLRGQHRPLAPEAITEEIGHNNPSSIDTEFYRGRDRLRAAKARSNTRPKIVRRPTSSPSPPSSSPPPSPPSPSSSADIPKNK
jgi:hypothetical protein